MKHSYTKRQWSVIGAGAVMLLALGWLDYVTGYELGVFVFYSVPVALVSWHVGRGPGILFSFFSALAWLLADMYAGQHYSRPFFLYWNTGIRFICFVINAVTMSKIRQTLEQQRRLREELATARSELVELKARSSLCPACRARQPVE